MSYARRNHSKLRIESPSAHCQPGKRCAFRLSVCVDRDLVPSFSTSSANGSQNRLGNRFQLRDGKTQTRPREAASFRMEASSGPKGSIQAAWKRKPGLPNQIPFRMEAQNRTGSANPFHLDRFRSALQIPIPIDCSPQNPHAAAVPDTESGSPAAGTVPSCLGWRLGARWTAGRWRWTLRQSLRQSLRLHRRRW